MLENLFIDLLLTYFPDFQKTNFSPTFLKFTYFKFFFEASSRLANPQYPKDPAALETRRESENLRHSLFIEPPS